MLLFVRLIKFFCKVLMKVNLWCLVSGWLCVVISMRWLWWNGKVFSLDRLIVLLMMLMLVCFCVIVLIILWLISFFRLILILGCVVRNVLSVFGKNLVMVVVLESSCM